MRAAVERHDDDGSIDVLVAVRVKVTNSEAADQEQGYRLRVKMAPDRRHLQDRPTWTRSPRDGCPRSRRTDRRPTRRRRSRRWRRGRRARAPSRSMCCRRRCAGDRARWRPGTCQRAARGWLWWLYIGRHRRGRPGADWSIAGCCRPSPAGRLGRALFGIAVRAGPTAPSPTRGCRSRCSPARPRPGAPARHRGVVRRLAVAAVGPPQPHVRRPAAAHRGAAGGRRHGATCAAPPGLCWWPPRWWPARRCGLNYLVVYRHDRAVDQARHQIAEQGPADRRADAQLRRRHAAEGLRPRAVRWPPTAIGPTRRAAAGGAEGGATTQRILGGQQRGAVRAAGPGVDAAGAAGPARHRPAER